MTENHPDRDGVAKILFENGPYYSGLDFETARATETISCRFEVEKAYGAADALLAAGLRFAR